MPRLSKVYCSLERIEIMSLTVGLSSPICPMRTPCRTDKDPRRQGCSLDSPAIALVPSLSLITRTVIGLRRNGNDHLQIPELDDVHRPVSTRAFAGLLRTLEPAPESGAAHHSELIHSRLPPEGTASAKATPPPRARSSRQLKSQLSEGATLSGLDPINRGIQNGFFGR